MTPYVLSVLTNLGLKVNLIQATGNQFWNTLSSRRSASTSRWPAGVPTSTIPITYMGYWMSSSMDMGATFDNADFDALLLEANAETDPMKRAEVLGEAEALFADIGPAIPLLHYKGAVAVQPRVKGMVSSIFGVDDQLHLRRHRRK